MSTYYWMATTLAMLSPLTTFSQTTHPGNKTNQEVISALYQAFAQKDVPTIMALTDPHVLIRQTQQLPWGGTYEGYAGLQLFLSHLFKGIDSHLAFEEYLQAGDQVVAIGRTYGRVRANGVPFDMRAVHVWTLKEGKVIGFEPYIHTPAMLEALQGKQSQPGDEPASHQK